MYQLIDVPSWKRKEVYAFFTAFEEPYFGITADVDVTLAYRNAKERNVSFFVWYLHKVLLTINGIPELKLRIVENEVRLYDFIHASATVSREDQTFGFSFMVFDENFDVFNDHANQEIQRIRSSENLFPERSGSDCIHFSSLPWVNFTSLSHARAYKSMDSVPKISVGKMTETAGKLSMPCSVHLHHGLADGKDAGRYFELFQDLLNEK